MAGPLSAWGGPQCVTRALWEAGTGSTLPLRSSRPAFLPPSGRGSLVGLLWVRGALAGAAQKAQGQRWAGLLPPGRELLGRWAGPSPWGLLLCLFPPSLCWPWSVPPPQTSSHGPELQAGMVPCPHLGGGSLTCMKQPVTGWGLTSQAPPHPGSLQRGAPSSARRPSLPRGPH